MLGFYWENQAKIDADLVKVREGLASARASGQPLDVRALRESLAASAAD